MKNYLVASLFIGSIVFGMDETCISNVKETDIGSLNNPKQFQITEDRGGIKVTTIVIDGNFIRAGFL